MRKNVDFVAWKLVYKVAESVPLGLSRGSTYVAGQGVVLGEFMAAPDMLRQESDLPTKHVMKASFPGHTVLLLRHASN